MGNTLEKKKSTKIAEGLIKKKREPEVYKKTPLQPLHLDRSTKANREHNEKIFLSPDLFLQILVQIDVRGFSAAICTCKTWRRLCDVEENWKAFTLFYSGESESLPAAFEELRLANYSWKEIFKLKIWAFAIDYIPPQYIKGLSLWHNARNAEPKVAIALAANHRLVDIGVKGNVGAGKSALVIRLHRGVFVENHDPAIEDYYRFLRDKGRYAALGIDSVYELLDYAVEEEFNALRMQFRRGESGFFVVYDITAKYQYSLQSAHFEIRSILRLKDCDNYPIVLVGAKLDLEAERVIPREMGMELARNYGIGFVELSSKTNTNTEEALAALATMIQVWPFISNELDECVQASAMFQHGSSIMKLEVFQALIEQSRKERASALSS